MSLKARLEQYLALVAESKDAAWRAEKLAARIRELEAEQVSDSVQGTRDDGTTGHIRITGVPLPEIDRLLGIRRKRETRMRFLAMELEQRAAELEAEIETIPDPTVRLILRQRYIDGMTWEHVSRRNGHAGTNWARMRATRYFEEVGACAGKSSYTGCAEA